MLNCKLKNTEGIIRSFKKFLIFLIMFSFVTIALMILFYIPFLSLLVIVLPITFNSIVLSFIAYGFLVLGIMNIIRMFLCENADLLFFNTMEVEMYLSKKLG